MDERHFTATVYIVKDRKVLLVHHKKIGAWLGVGGHIEKNETPDIALAREVREETGIEIEIIGNRNEKIGETGSVGVLMTPRHILLENINNDHEHIDMIYFARPGQGNVRLKKDEHHDIRWFAEEELDSIKAPHNVKYLAKEAIEELR